MREAIVIFMILGLAGCSKSSGLRELTAWERSENHIKNYTLKNKTVCRRPLFDEEIKFENGKKVHCFYFYCDDESNGSPDYCEAK